jgi:hypothetical protein
MTVLRRPACNESNSKRGVKRPGLNSERLREQKHVTLVSEMLSTGSVMG